MTGASTGMWENAASYRSAFIARNRTQQYRPVRERTLIYCVGPRGTSFPNRDWPLRCRGQRNRCRRAAVRSSAAVETRQQSPRMTIRTALATLLAIALFAWFLSRANLSGIAAEIAHARMDLIVWSVVIAALMPVLRALRWQYLLDPVGPTRFGPVLRATIIGFAALALLPARAGDVIRPYLVARSERLVAASVFATIVMERALDVIVVLTLLASLVWLFDGRAILPAAVLAPIQASATLAGGIVIALLVVMWTLATHPERIERLVATHA